MLRSEEIRFPAYRPDQLLIVLDQEARGTASSTDAKKVALEASVRSPFAALEREGLIEDVTAVGQPDTRGRATNAVRTLAASVAPETDPVLAGLNLVRLAPGASIAEVKRRLDDVPAVREIENVPYRTIAPPRAPQGARATRGQLGAMPWNLAAIGWTAATPPDAEGVKVAVLDTGVDEGHPSLAIAGYEHEDVSAEDIVGHGTHVCGILAGKRSARSGFSGVSNVQTYVWKIFSDEPDVETGLYLVDEVLYLRALLAALKAGCRVMNLSIGGSATNKSERSLFKRLVEGGVTIVAAMGNEYLEGNPIEYPAAHADVIAVGAVDDKFKRAGFSNTGNHITIVAPGVDILSTLPRKKSVARTEKSYASWDGTSMATPHVAAAAARLIAGGVASSPKEVKDALIGQAKKLPEMHSRGWTRLYGNGLLQL